MSGERLTAFVSAMLEAENDGNNYAAIALGLTLPDICGSIDQPGNGKSQQRYIAWWDAYPGAYFNELFSDPADPGLISGVDAWALRCAFLHSGQDRPSGSKPVKRVRFISERIGSAGSDAVNGVVYVAVDLFVRAVQRGVERWLADKSGDEDVGDRLQQLLQIMSPDEFYDLIIDAVAIN